MYGAILGDIIGSRFEFDRGGKTKDFDLFTDECSFTDDTAMTIAVGEALMNAGRDASVEDIKKEVIRSMKTWGKKYPNAGYGGRFYSWLFFQRDPKPYGSWGNGSAMRVSAAGLFYDTLERTRDVARATAEVTHNHPEGIKGAECTAAVMFLARNGMPKEEIREYVISEFGYDLSESLDELRARHEHVESCQDSLPKALVSFFEGESYEDVVRNAVSLGGDTDTLAAIAGAMAEACYGIPFKLLLDAEIYIPEDMTAVINRFSEELKKASGEPEGRFENNRFIKMAAANIDGKDPSKGYLVLLDVLTKRVMEEGEVPMPMVDVNNVMASVDMEKLGTKDSFTLNEDLRLVCDTMQTSDGKQWFALFTDYDEMNKGETTNININYPIRLILEDGLNSDRVEGVVINPFEEKVILNKQVLKILADHMKTD